MDYHTNPQGGAFTMDRNQDYIVNSLELHLFFARIMKEHAFFLKVGLMPPDASLAREGENLLRLFESLLSRTIALSNRIVRSCVLNSGEIFTEFTDKAERQTQRLTGTFINRNLTARAMNLNGWNCSDDLEIQKNLTNQIHQLNRDGITLVERLISFKERILNSVNSCNIFTVNYPLLIEHILREARLYCNYLMQLEGMDACDCRELRNSELFWNQIMMEHALFIRGLLDPSEEELICTSDDFAKDYKCLLETAQNANDRIIRNNDSLALTRKFRDFKQAGVKGIEGCKIKSIILPLLADHVLREANHYIRLLED